MCESTLISDRGQWWRQLGRRPWKMSSAREGATLVCAIIRRITTRCHSLLLPRVESPCQQGTVSMLVDLYGKVFSLHQSSHGWVERLFLPLCYNCCMQCCNVAAPAPVQWWAMQCCKAHLEGCVPSLHASSGSLACSQHHRGWKW